MDIYCKHCQEPLDNDELHEIAAEFDTTYDVIRDAFYKLGCGIFDGPTANPCPRGNGQVSGVIEATYDLLGDDTDGAAAMLDEWQAMGNTL